MTIWQEGSAALSLRTQSMPLMPGRLMSMRTTSGLCLGSSARASSPVEWWLRHSKPGAREIKPARLSRTRGSSSTIDTVTGTDKLCQNESLRDNRKGGVLGWGEFEIAEAQALA